MGAGNVPSQELPARPKSSTPAELEAEYKVERDKILEYLKDILAINEKMGPFCTDPKAVVTLHVAPQNHSKIYQRQYQVPWVLKEHLRNMIKKWVSETKVKLAPENCEFNLPLLVAAKYDKDGKVCGLRICIDARILNQYLLENDRFEIPRIGDVLQRFAGCKIFGEFDLSEAYFQFPLHPDSQKYTAFTVDNQQYMFVSCPYGLKHLPSFFQRYMVNLFKDMPFVNPYIDNLPIASKTWEEHKQHCYMIIERLNSVGLRIKPASINIGNSEIRILGHLINAQGINMDPAKKKVITEWPKPVGGPELAAFLGLATFLRDHVRHYCDMAGPLEPLKKQKFIQWTDYTTQCFNNLQRAFKTAPFLKYPDFDERFAVADDSSIGGAGGVLYQPDDDNDTITPYNIVAICSKKYTKSQYNYHIYKKELWAMVYCLRKFHSYIWGRRDTVVYTDHKPLIHILHQTQLSVSLQQWLDIILNYDLTIKYRPGMHHLVPDALSRLYAYSYQDDKTVWGIHDNIRFIEDSQKCLSPSDFLCQQSIDQVKTPTTVNKRHRMYIENGEGKHTNESTTISNFSSSSSLSSTFTPHSSNQVNYVVTTNDFTTQYQYDDSFYRIDEFDVENDQSNDLMNEETQLDFELSSQYGSLCYASTYNIPNPPIIINSYDTPFSYQVVKSEEYNNNNPNDNKPEINIENEPIAPVDPPSQKLSEEEKLLLALDRRGVKLPIKEQRQEILDRVHHMGHLGISHMYKSIKDLGYWWPKLYQDLEATVNNCDDCLRHTIGHHGYHPTRSVTALLPGDHFIMDIMELPNSTDGLSDLLVIVDVFTGFIILKPLINKEPAVIARALWEVFCTFGPPRILQHDQEASFLDPIMKALYKLTGVHQRVISQYHPQADGKVERAIQTIRDMINKELKGAHEYWPLFVPFAQMCYNYRIAEVTGSSPFSLMFGRKMNELIDYINETTPTKVDYENWKEYQEKVLSLIFPAVHLRSKRIQQKYIDKLQKYKRQLLEHDLAPGTCVYIKDPTFIKNPSTRPKSNPRYLGPYYIVRRSLHGPYVLRDETGDVYERQVPLDQMKVTKAAKWHIKYHDKDDVYQIDRIVDEKREKGVRKFLIKWAGYSHKDNTWEPATSITDKKIIQRYERQRKGKQTDVSDLSTYLYLVSATEESPLSSLIVLE